MANRQPHAKKRRPASHTRTVLRDLGVVLHVPGLMALVSIPLCWVFDESYAVPAFALTAAVSLAPGQALFRTFRDAEAMRLRHAMVTAVASWALVPLVGLLPLLLVAWSAPDLPELTAALKPFRSFVNALFEAMSGFTSTGLTMAEHPAALPHCLQWWRSFMQWVGGVGVIVLMLSIFHPEGDSYRLYFAEGREGTILPEVADTARTIWWIYLLYTAASAVSLRATGMDWWEALNYAMAGIATGGFGVTDHSLADFGVATRLVMVLIMLTGAVSFAVHFRVLRHRRLNVLWREPQCQSLFGLLLVGSLLLALENYWYTGAFSWSDSLFQWASAATTAGFGTVPLEGWSPSAHILLVFGMIVGGMAGSTTGGLKLKRLGLLASGAYTRVRSIALHPWRLMEHKPIGDVEGRAGRNLEAAALMAVLWALTLFAGTLVLLHAVEPGTPLDRVLLEVASALGNVGLTSGITTPELAWSGKLALAVIMWMGRLEIVPVLVLVAALWRGLPKLPGA